MEENIGLDVFEMAKFMHNKYEELAKKEGWNTQDKCKVEFEKLPEANKRVMLGLAFGIIDWMNKNQEKLGKLVPVPDEYDLSGHTKAELQAD